MDVSMESEDEVFFGAMSEKEKQIAARYKGRRTEIYCPGFRENRSSQQTLDDYACENGEKPLPPNLLDEGVPQIYRLFNSPNSARQRRLYKDVDTAELVLSRDLQDSMEASAVETIHQVSPCSPDTSLEENTLSEQLERTFYNLSVQAERGSEIMDESILFSQDSFEIEDDVSDEKELKNSFSKSDTEMNEVKPEDLEITENVAKRHLDEENAEELLYLRLSSTDSEAVKLNEEPKAIFDSLEEPPSFSSENNSELSYPMRSKPQDFKNELSASCCLESSSSGFKLVCSSMSSESVGISLKMNQSSGQQSKSDKSDDFHNETVDEIEENLPRDSLDSSSHFDTSLNKDIDESLSKMDNDDTKGNESVDLLCGKLFVNSLFKDDLSFTDSDGGKNASLSKMDNVTKGNESADQLSGKLFVNSLFKDLSFTNTVGKDLDGGKNASTEMSEANSVNSSLDENAFSITTDILKNISGIMYKESDLNKQDCLILPTGNYPQSTKIAQLDVIENMDVSLNKSNSKPFDQGLINSASEEKVVEDDDICAGNLENEEFVSDNVQTECDSKAVGFLKENDDIIQSAVIQNNGSENPDANDDTSSTSCLNRSLSDIHGTLSESCSGPFRGSGSSENEMKSDEIDEGKNNPENDTLDEIEESLSIDNVDNSFAVPSGDVNIVEKEMANDKLSQEQSEAIKNEEMSISVPSCFVKDLNENVLADKSDVDEMSPQKTNESCSELNSQGFASSSESSGNSIMIASSEFSSLDESTSWVYSEYSSNSTELNKEKEDIEQKVDVTVVSVDNLDKEKDELCNKFSDCQVNTSNRNSEIDKQYDNKIHTVEEKSHSLQKDLDPPQVSQLLAVSGDLSRESSPKTIVDDSTKTALNAEESAMKTAILENDIIVVDGVSKDEDSSEVTADFTTAISSYSCASFTVDSIDGNAVVNFSDSLSIPTEVGSRDNVVNTEEESRSERIDSEKKMEVFDSISEGLNNLHLKTEEVQEQRITNATDESDSVKNQSEISGVDVIPQTPSKFKFVSFRSGRRSSDKKKAHKEAEKPAKIPDQPESNEMSSLSSISIASSLYVNEINLLQQQESLPESNELNINEADKENSEPQPDISHIPNLPPGKFCYTSTPKTLKNASGSNLSSTRSTPSVNRNTPGTMKPPRSAQKVILKKVQVPVVSAYKKPRLDNIESPVAKYINEFPASPLIKNVKCRTMNKPSSLPIRSKIPLPPRAQKPQNLPTGKGSNISNVSMSNNSSKTRTTPKAVAERISTSANVSITKTASSEPKARRELQSLMQQEKSSQATDNTPVLPNKNYTGTTSLSLTPERLEMLSEIHRSSKKHKSNLGIATSPQPTIIKHRRLNALQWANELATESTQKSSPKHVTTIAKPVVQEKPFDESSLDVTGQDMEISVMEIQHPAWTKTLAKT